MSRPMHETTLQSQELDTFDQSELFDDEAWFATPDLTEPSKSLLEVHVSWEGGLLDICHYATPRKLTFGSGTHTDFCYPLEDASDTKQAISFPLIQPGKGGFLLCFEPEMEGIVEQNGERLTLLDLVNEGRAHFLTRSGLCYYPLLPGTQVQLHFGGLDIQLRFVPTAPFHMSVLRRLDTSAPIMSFAVIAHLLFALLAISATHAPPSKQITTDKHIKRNAPPLKKKHNTYTQIRSSKQDCLRLALQNHELPKRCLKKLRDLANKKP